MPIVTEFVLLLMGALIANTRLVAPAPRNEVASTVMLPATVSTPCPCACKIAARLRYRLGTVTVEPTGDFMFMPRVWPPPILAPL